MIRASSRRLLQSSRRSSPPAEKHPFFTRPGDPLVLHGQAMAVEVVVEAIHRVTIRKEEPDFFTGTKLELFTGDTQTARMLETKPGGQPHQITRTRFDRPFQSAVVLFHAEIEQKH